MIFFDIVQDGHKVQVMCNKRQLDGVSPEEFKKYYRLLRRGDAFCMFLAWDFSVLWLNFSQLWLVDRTAPVEAI